MKTWTVAKNVLRRIVRDPRTLILIALTPLFFILLYGYSFSSGKPTHLGVVIVNQDNGLASVRTEEVGRITLTVSLGDQLVKSLDPDSFEITLSDDPLQAEEQAKRGRDWAALILPQNFSHALVNEALRLSGPKTISYEGRTVRVLPPEEGESPLATLFLDDSNPVITSTVLLAFNDAVSRLLSTQQASLSPASELLDLHPLYGGHVSPLDYTAPGVIGFAMTLITIMLTVISIVRERTSGTLTRLLIAPVHPWEVSLGYTFAFALISLLQVGELFLVSHWLFHIRFAGSPLLVALVVITYAIGLQGIATLLSTVARNEFQAMQFILVLLIPSIMLSGVFWPIEAMPANIRFLTWFSPLTYANEALREVMLRGRAISGIVLELSVLAGFALLMLILGVFSMRRQGYSA
jgi:ABC-2 type transport system permease protein